MADQQTDIDFNVKEPAPAAPAKKRGMNIFLTLAIVVMGVALIYLLITLSKERKDAEEMRVTLEMKKDNLTSELNDLYSSYNKLKTENDSMNTLVEREKQKIQELLKIKASNAKKIQIYEKEVTSLRSVLKSYIIQVDSLNSANLKLRAENKEVKERFDQAKNVNKQLEEQNKDLQGKVEKASTLKALNIIAEPISDNGTVQKKSRNASKIRVCFTLGENAVAKKGPKIIYLRISNPNERIMVKSGTDTFELNGNQAPFSAMRDVEYEGDALEACIYYEAAADEIIAGTYYIDLYLEGGLIGTSSFSLK